MTTEREQLARTIATALDSSYGELIEKPVTDVDYELADILIGDGWTRAGVPVA